MSLLKKVCFIIIQLIWLIDYSNEQFLIYPPSSPTRYQFLAGFGVPVDLELESVTIGYVFKAEYWLPYNASTYIKILGDPLGPTPMPLSSFGRKIQKRSPKIYTQNGNSIETAQTNGYDKNTQQKYEKYETEAVEIDNVTNESSATSPEIPVMDLPSIMDAFHAKQPSNLATYRWTLYKGLAMLAETNGLPGRSCVLRMICEAAHAPFTFKTGVLGELMRVILSPSSTTDKVMHHSDNEYLKAEYLGKSGAPCHQVFRECQQSILDEFSGMYDNVENILESLGYLFCIFLHFVKTFSGKSFQNDRFSW